jgi:hypothetical protein
MEYIVVLVTSYSRYLASASKVRSRPRGCVRPRKEARHHLHSESIDSWIRVPGWFSSTAPPGLVIPGKAPAETPPPPTSPRAAYHALSPPSPPLVKLYAPEPVAGSPHARQPLAECGRTRGDEAGLVTAGACSGHICTPSTLSFGSC